MNSVNILRILVGKMLNRSYIAPMPLCDQLVRKREKRREIVCLLLDRDGSRSSFLGDYRQGRVGQSQPIHEAAKTRRCYCNLFPRVTT